MAVLFAVSCGDSPNRPGPVPNAPPPPPPPVNNSAPSISSITLQGTKQNEPPNYSDVGETVAVSAAVTDAESNVDSLQYNWTATLGTFTGTGARVSWVAPATATTPVTVTITLEVVERFGTNQENRVSKTATLALHDNSKEVGDMASRFLAEFSKPQTNKNWQDIMRDFKASACPDPREIDNERNDVVNHYTNFFMNDYRIDPPRVTTNFGGTCPRANAKGDACAAVGVRWNSTNTTTKVTATTVGIDHVSAAFSTADNRWWLCSSYFEPTTSLGHSFYLR